MSQRNRPSSGMNRNIQKLRFRFMAMSKLIGIIAFCFILIIAAYAMYEMHITQTYDSLPQLIISAFGFASIYAGFYLTMAKAEHIEEERTKRETELARLKAQKDVDSAELMEKRQQINDTISKLLELMNNDNNSSLLP